MEFEETMVLINVTKPHKIPIKTFILERADVFGCDVHTDRRMDRAYRRTDRGNT